MKIDILTLFPNMFDGVFQESILKRAIEDKKVEEVAMETAPASIVIPPRVEVYEGMIVGICNREEDLSVNITKEKQQTNQRSSTKDTTVVLKRPRVMNLENYLEFINDDELVEVTPKSLRLRKVILNTNDRKRYDSYHSKKA